MLRHLCYLIFSRTQGAFFGQIRITYRAADPMDEIYSGQVECICTKDLNLDLLNGVLCEEHIPSTRHLANVVFYPGSSLQQESNGELGSGKQQAKRVIYSRVSTLSTRGQR